MFQSFFNKPCMACHKRPAKIKFIKVSDGDWQECMICQFCAQSIASEEKSGAHLKMDHVFETLLSGGAGNGPDGGLLPTPGPHGGAKAPANDPMCPSCGLSYSHYRPTLMLGCSECYQAFGELLDDDLRRIHGASRHKGLRPPGRTSAEPAESAASGRSAGESLSSAARERLEEEAAAPLPAQPGAADKPSGKEAAARRSVRLLRKRLQEAVENEEFDKAALLRDQIKELEGGNAAPTGKEGGAGEA